MAKIPQPRKAGQTGGGGRHGQAGNRSRSQDRGGRPHAGGGGSGKKPGGGSSFVEDSPGMAYGLMAYALLIVVSPFLLVGGIVWALIS